MFKIYDRYFMRQSMLATLVIAGALSMIVLLTQSLKLIEIVLQSSASASAFISMVALSWPRFVEAVLPISAFIATLFAFHRMGVDSELVVLRASGLSPMRLARPVITAGLILASLLLILSLWVAPSGIWHMQTLRKEVQNQYTHLLFRQGVFNSVGKNLTAYVRTRTPDGRLLGLMLHDTRGRNEVTVVAHEGHIVTEKQGQKIVVYDGSRQELNPKTGQFSRLDFKQYTLDIPESSDQTSKRWREPDERTIAGLTNSSALAAETPKTRAEFRAELHRRFSTPLLMLGFALSGAAFLLCGAYARTGQMPLIGAAALSCLLIQGSYMAAFNIAKKSLFGCTLLYGVALIPLLLALFMLSTPGQNLLFKARSYIQKRKHATRGNI